MLAAAAWRCNRFETGAPLPLFGHHAVDEESTNSPSLLDPSQMSHLGHEPTFSTPPHNVWNAAMNRHSGLNVGNGTVSGP
jgi:hypothetical protein